MNVWLSWAACAMVVDFGDPPAGSDDSATPSPTGPDSASDTGGRTPPTEPTGDLGDGSVIGGPGDAIGSGGLWWVPADGTFGLRLAIGNPARDEVVLVDVDGIGPRTALGAAATTIRGGGVGGAFVAATGALVVGATGPGEVWLLDRAATGALGEDDPLASVSADDGDGEDFGASVAVGDLDGDGVEDLVIGDPSGRGGDGAVSAGPIDEILAAGDGSDDDAPFHLRGSGGGLGTTTAVGDVDGSGLDAVIACAVDDDRCWVVPGDADADDRDVEDVASASIALPRAGFAPPTAQDVDGDGLLELVVPATGGLWVFRRPTGASDEADAVAVIAGDVLAVGTDSAPVVWAGVPGDDAVYGVPSPAGAVDVAAGPTPLVGTAGSGFGAAVSGREPGGRLAAAAPEAGGGAGEVRLFSVP